MSCAYNVTAQFDSAPRYDIEPLCYGCKMAAPFRVRTISGGPLNDRKLAIACVKSAARFVSRAVPYPDDSSEHVYGLVDEDVDEDLVLRFLTECELPIPDRDFTEQFGVVDSPRRIVQFLNACRRRGEG